MIYCYKMNLDYIGINWYDLCQAFENSLFRYFRKKCKNGNDLETLKFLQNTNEENSNRREITDSDVYKYITIIIGII